MRKFFILAAVAVAGLGSIVFADEEAPSLPYVKSSEYGQFYAKSVPAEEYDWENRTKGKTFVYSVGAKEDTLLYTCDWFAQELFLLDHSGSLVRLGPWARGHEPKKEDLAIGFYLNGETLKEYSALDIVNTAYDDKASIGMSVSHYRVFQDMIGYRWLGGNKWAFDVKTYEGKILSFDSLTGEIRSQEEERVDAITNKIQDLKIEWYVNNRNMQDQSEYHYKLTFDELKDWGKDRVPEIPEGYTVSVGSFFEEVKLEKTK